MLTEQHRSRPRTTSPRAASCSEDYALARDALTAARDDAERRGSPIGFAFASGFRALPNLRLGELDAAEADSLDVLAVCEEHGLTVALPGAVIWLLETLNTRGRFDEAQALLDRTDMDGAVPFQTWFLHLLEKRGNLRVAQGRLDAAVAVSARGRGGEAVAVGGRSTADTFWRSALARALVGLGRDDEAREIAEQELSIARAFGGAHAIARALLGVVTTMPDGDVALALLGEARTSAAAASTPVIEAQALVAAGSMLRRTSQRAAARDTLREALDGSPRAAAPTDSR